MTYNVFGGTLNLTQSINQPLIVMSELWSVSAGLTVDKKTVTCFSVYHCSVRLSYERFLRWTLACELGLGFLCVFCVFLKLRPVCFKVTTSWKSRTFAVFKDLKGRWKETELLKVLESVRKSRWICSCYAVHFRRYCFEQMLHSC